MVNADVTIRSAINLDQFIDCIEGNKKYVPAIICVNKTDLIDEKQKKELKETLEKPIFVSAKEIKGIEELKDSIYNILNFARVYLKEINKKPDMNEPMILTQPVTLKAVCENIHKDFIKKFRYARIWGKSAKFPGQQFNKIDKVLADEDIVEIHII